MGKIYPDDQKRAASTVISMFAGDGVFMLVCQDFFPLGWFTNRSIVSLDCYQRLSSFKRGD